ncbi:transporter associated domain-containing protein, partial [Veillonella sp.]|uniref:transporter associated domain-containing protein n=1 Tax=Veillonella sp. TaxID=1926307 RepID=UPI00257DF077
QYRIPVGEDSLDELRGVVNVTDVMVQCLQGEKSLHHVIHSCLKEPLLVPESISLMKLLNTLRNEGVHETIVLDEYGGFSGLVTLHDIMEEIVGLMPSGEEEIKEEENKIIERDGAWLVDGLLNVDEFKEFFHIDQELPGEEDDLYKTMGGLLNVLFGRIPKELDKTKWNGYTFEVIDMDHTRIDKILVTYEEPIVEQEEEK